MWKVNLLFITQKFPRAKFKISLTFCMRESARESVVATINVGHNIPSAKGNSFNIQGHSEQYLNGPTPNISYAPSSV